MVSVFKQCVFVCASVCLLACTIRPLVASSGIVMDAGVVRRFRARVSCSITASMSYSNTRNRKLVSDTVKDWDLIHVWNRAPQPRGGTDLIDLSPRLEVVALITTVQKLQSLVHMVSGILDLMVDWRHGGKWVRRMSGAGLEH